MARVARGIAAGLLALGLTACQGTPQPRPPFERQVNVGMAPSSPGWSEQDSAGRRHGFDYDVTDWLAGELDLQANISNTLAADRESKLQRGDVQVIVASYSITDKRREVVGFAGPYAQTYQGFMIRRDERDAYRRLSDLKGKAICVTRGSTSAIQLKEEFAWPVTVVERDAYDECLELLLAADPIVDVVSTDQLLLFGYAAKHPRTFVPQQLVFGEQQRYGIGLPKGDIEKCRVVTAELRHLISDGTWLTFFREHFPEYDPTPYKPSALDPCPDPPPAATP